MERICLNGLVMPPPVIGNVQTIEKARGHIVGRQAADAFVIWAVVEVIDVCPEPSSRPALSCSMFSVSSEVLNGADEPIILL